MKSDKTTPFWDSSLSIEERLDWLLAEMTLEEKLSCLSSRVPALDRIGIPAMSVGGEAAHGVEARNDQNELGAPEPTTSFPQPIGMSATWDPEVVKKAGDVTGREARVIYQRHPDRGLSRWAPTVDLERDPAGEERKRDMEKILYSQGKWLLLMCRECREMIPVTCSLRLH